MVTAKVAERANGGLFLRWMIWHALSLYIRVQQRRLRSSNRFAEASPSVVLNIDAAKAPRVRAPAPTSRSLEVQAVVFMQRRSARIDRRRTVRYVTTSGWSAGSSLTVTADRPSSPLLRCCPSWRSRRGLRRFMVSTIKVFGMRRLHCTGRLRFPQPPHHPHHHHHHRCHHARINVAYVTNTSTSRPRNN